MSGKISYHIGRILLGMMLIGLGYFLYTSGHQQFDKYLHAVRKLILPDSQASSKIPYLEITYERLNQYLVKADGALFAISGILVIGGSNTLGGVLMLVATAFILATKDNPLLVNTKSLQRE
jgi:hypothetical protein